VHDDNENTLQLGNISARIEQVSAEMDGYREPLDDKRPGLRARTVQHVARDLLLARQPPSGTVPSAPRVDIGEMLGRRGRAIFLVGAGCSASAGIPLAAQVAQECVKILARRYSPPKGEIKEYGSATDGLINLIGKGMIPRRYNSSATEPDWVGLYTYLFAEHLKSPNHQREVISSVIGERQFSLNWAHACLGHLVQQRYVHTVLTTNFDQLVLQGIIRTGILPVVADGLESLTRISPSPANPQVVHLHGSMHTYDLRNSPAALSETGDDRKFQTMMMSLLQHATVLIVVGYAGGEEGIMKLLQYAAENLPRMVIYWVAYEQDYIQLSLTAKNLLETGENKFFVLGQDADQFFQRLMSELGEGQPNWVVDPINVLIQQGEGLKFGNDREIGDLVADYNRRVNHALANKYAGDANLVPALQARYEGDFAGAVDKLEPIRASSQRIQRLYARSLQDLFDNQPDGDNNDAKIEAAVIEFRNLAAADENPLRLADQIALIEALFDVHERKATKPLSDEDKARLAEVLTVIQAARKGAMTSEETDIALLDFYEARALQERSEELEGEVAQKVIDAYRRAANALEPAGGQKALEAKDGLAQALVSFAEARIDKEAGVIPEVIVRDLYQGIEIHNQLVEYFWHNYATLSFPGALENLAYDYAVLAKAFARGPTERVRLDPLREAEKALSRASSAYQLAGETDRASDAIKRLEELRQRLRT
jgi:hypothetical protein